MRDIFVVLHVVPVGPLDGEDLRPISAGSFELLRGVVRRLEHELHDLLSDLRLHTQAKGQVAVVKRLLLGEVGDAERLLVRFGDDGRLIVLVGLPEDHLDLVVGEVLAPEKLHVLVRVALGPAVPVTLLDPLAVSVSHPVALIAERFWLFLDLLAGVNEHHAAAVAGRFLATQQPHVSKDARVVENLIRKHHDSVEPVVFQNRAANFAFARAAVAIGKR